MTVALLRQTTFCHQNPQSSPKTYSILLSFTAKEAAGSPLQGLKKSCLGCWGEMPSFTNYHIWFRPHRFWQQERLAETQSDETRVVLTESWCSWVPGESDTPERCSGQHISLLFLMSYFCMRNFSSFLLRRDVWPHLRLRHHFSSLMGYI